ncbi:MAG: heavy-metal-associated domain-containing protein, partial [Actinomycetota bacterium]
MTTETLSVPDISCGHCQRTIESTLGNLPGVRAAAVDVASRTVRVTYDEM